MSTAPAATGSITISASPERVYDLVSNPKKIVEFAEETFKIFTVGSRWIGFNRNGWHVWPTFTKIIEAAPGREFTFEVSEFGFPVSRWQYKLEHGRGRRPRHREHVGPTCGMVRNGDGSVHRCEGPPDHQHREHRKDARAPQDRRRGITPGRRHGAWLFVQIQW